MALSSWWRGVEPDAEGTLCDMSAEECVSSFRKGGGLPDSSICVSMRKVGTPLLARLACIA